jgi:hypothetical protein
LWDQVIDGLRLLRRAKGLDRNRHAYGLEAVNEHGIDRLKQRDKQARKQQKTMKFECAGGKMADGAVSGNETSPF